MSGTTTTAKKRKHRAVRYEKFLAIRLTEGSYNKLRRIALKRSRAMGRNVTVTEMVRDCALRVILQDEGASV